MSYQDSFLLECPSVILDHQNMLKNWEIMFIQPAREARGLLLADGTPTGGRGEDFLSRQLDFFTETAVTPERKVEKWFPRWEINRHVEG